LGEATFWEGLGFYKPQKQQTIRNIKELTLEFRINSLFKCSVPILHTPNKFPMYLNSNESQLPIPLMDPLVTFATTPSANISTKHLVA